MDNIKIIKDIQKKYSLKLHRNATLDSTSSTLKLQKIKIYEGLSPLVDLTKKTNFKPFMDIPVCMSLYTKNIQQKEIEQKKKENNKRKKIILKNINKFDFKKLLIPTKKESKKDLILPITKNGVNKKSNGSTNNILSPKYSNIINYLNHIKQLNYQSSRNIIKPKLKEIKNVKMIKFTQRTNPIMKILKSKKLGQINNHNLKTYDFENSNNKSKNFSFGGLKLNLNNKINSMNEINNKLQNDKKIEDKKINNIDNIKMNITNNNKINNIGINKENNIEEKNKNVNIKSEEFKQNLVINENINEKNDSRKENIQIKKINSNIKKKQDSNLLNKYDKNHKIKNKKKLILNVESIKKPTIIEDFNKKEEKNILNLTSHENSKEKKYKFNITSYEKKNNKIYKKNQFLEMLNEEFIESSKNKKINSKIISYKENILTCSKDELGNYIFNENLKVIKHSIQNSTTQEIRNMMDIYFKEILSEKNKINKYKEAYINIFVLKTNDKFNCIIGSVTRDYIFMKYSDNIILSPNNNIENHNDEIIRNFKREEKLNTLKRNKTFIQDIVYKPKKTFDTDNCFSVRKSQDMIINYGQNLKNFIMIQELMLKSLPFYKENYLRLINFHHHHNSVSQRHFNFRAIDVKKSGRFTSLNPFNSSSKKNSYNTLGVQGITGSFRRKGDRRSGSILNIDSIKQTLRVIQTQKTEPKDSTFSILKHKRFFRKGRNNFEGIIESGEIFPSCKSFEDKFEFEANEEDSKLKSIYLQLMKAIYNGKYKIFTNYYNQSKKIIDINQILIEGNTLLLLAVKEGNYQITKFLCEEGADVNVQNADGNSALHYAIGKQFYSIADILTTHGAMEDLINLKGFTPWDCIEHNVE